MQTELVRQKLFNVRFSDEEWGRLDRLAKHYGLNAAGLLRMLLKREEDTVFPKALSQQQGAILSALLAAQPLTIEALGPAVARHGYDNPARWLGREVNTLRRAGLIEKTRGAYLLTPKGRNARF